MPWRENKGVANLDGFKTDFFSCLKARNLGGNLCLDVADARNEIPISQNL